MRHVSVINNRKHEALLPYVTEKNSSRMRLVLMRTRYNVFLSFLVLFPFSPSFSSCGSKVTHLLIHLGERSMFFPNWSTWFSLYHFRSCLSLIESCSGVMWFLYMNHVGLCHASSSSLEWYQLLSGKWAVGAKGGYLKKSLNADPRGGQVNAGQPKPVKWPPNTTKKMDQKRKRVLEAIAVLSTDDSQLSPVFMKE